MGARGGIGTNAQSARDGYYFGMRLTRKVAAWIIGIIGAICTILLFLFTEDMRLPMIFVNQYTMYYAAVVIFELAMLAISVKNAWRIRRDRNLNERIK